MEKFIVCRNFNDDEIFNEKRVDLLTEIAERVGLCGNIFRSYIIYKLSHEPNLISTTIERTDGKVGEVYLPPSSTIYKYFSTPQKILIRLSTS